MSQVSTELYIRNFIFDFATRYYWNHPDIKSPSQFVFADKDYNDFKEFLKSRKFNYTTDTEQSLDELISDAKKEKYFDLHKDLFTELEKDVAHNLDKDLLLFRDEIKELLEEEIIGRYFYEGGAISWSITKDEQVKKALETLRDKNTYSSVLSGKAKSVLITGKDNQGIYGNKIRITQEQMPV